MGMKCISNFWVSVAKLGIRSLFFDFVTLPFLSSFSPFQPYHPHTYPVETFY